LLPPRVHTVVTAGHHQGCQLMASRRSSRAPVCYSDWDNTRYWPTLGRGSGLGRPLSVRAAVAWALDDADHEGHLCRAGGQVADAAAGAGDLAGGAPTAHPDHRWFHVTSEAPVGGHTIAFASIRMTDTLIHQGSVISRAAFSARVSRRRTALMLDLETPVARAICRIDCF
jgi:hypothetical protein